MPDKSSYDKWLAGDPLNADRELAKIRYALDHSAIVAITDQTGKIIHVNDKFCEISKYSREELVGQNHRIINSGYHGMGFFVQMWNTISRGKIWEGEIKNRAKDGSFYWVNTTIVPFLNEAGKPYQYVSIRYEITQRKQAEEQLRIYADELERKNQEIAKSLQMVVERESQILVQDRLASVGLLASSLAHEIGTPLGVIRGRAEFLQMKLKENPEALKTASVIIAQIDRVSKLIRSLLNLARGENTKHVATVKPREVLNELGELMAHEFRKAEADFAVEVPEAVMVKAEAGPLNQVFMNLLVNAIHAIQSAKQQGKNGSHFVRVIARESGDFWAISFQDSGCGISEANMKKLFQPFFTTKDIGKGTGLGLVTSYRIVESWGGNLSVLSKQGEGATFTLNLPKS